MSLGLRVHGVRVAGKTSGLSSRFFEGFFRKHLKRWPKFLTGLSQQLGIVRSGSCLSAYLCNARLTILLMFDIRPVCGRRVFLQLLSPLPWIVLAFFADDDFLGDCWVSKKTNRLTLSENPRRVVTGWVPLHKAYVSLLWGALGLHKSYARLTWRKLST